MIVLVSCNADFLFIEPDLVALARYWQNEFHYMDKAPHDNKDVQLTFYFSFIRLASNDCHRRYNSCRFQPLSLLAVNLLFENDHFRGLLVQFKARNIISGMEAVVESHLHPRYYNNFTDRFLGKSRLQFLEVDIFTFLGLRICTDIQPVLIFLMYCC